MFAARTTAARRAAALAGLTALLGVLLGYGYGPDQDPFTRAIRALAADAQAGRWRQAVVSLEELRPALREIEQTLPVARRPQLEEAIARRDRGALAQEITALVYLMIRLRFESCRREALTRYYPAKYRIRAAREHYTQLLAPVIRRRDRERSSDLHRRIWAAFDAAVAALGRPGFLGRGVVPPDPQGFDKASAALDEALREGFPFLREVMP
ncbi:MAG: hypothetical protein ACE5FG_09710 [Myxococcota bacterium]